MPVLEQPAAAPLVTATPLTAPTLAAPMLAANYAQARGWPITVLSRFVHPVPALPISVDGRRQDVFNGYAAFVKQNAETLPVQVYTVELQELAIAYDTTRRTLAARVGDTPLSDAFRYASTAPVDDAPAVELPGTSLIIAEGHAGSFYHFLLNSLVRLAVVMQTHPRQVFDHFVVTDAAPPFVRQALAMLGIEETKIVSLAQSPRVICERAMLGQYISDLIFPHRLAAQLLRGLFPTSICTGERLYIVRSGKRRVTNDDEIWNILRPRGFQRVYAERLTLTEQARLFASADAVVAPHGAGLANLVFSPAGTKVIELLSPRFVETIYWYLATSCGHTYGNVIGRGADAPLSNKLNPGGWRSDNPADMDIDPAILNALCDRMGL